MPREDLEKFFYPESVAIIGASTKPEKLGHIILKSLLESGYRGRIYPINPKAEEILGLKCYPSILDVPEPVDLAVIVLPAHVVPSVVEQCGKKGTKNVVVISGGFKELGGEYADAERKMVEIARKYGVRIIGPNCIGVFNADNKLDTFFQSRDRMVRPKKGPISFITQSGTFGCTMLEWAEHIGMSKFVSYGNRCDVDEADLIEYLAEDPGTKVIAVYVEGLGDARRFMEVARRVTPKKPIVMLKAGRTREGSKAAASHTGCLAGTYELYRAMFKQAGIIEAKNFEELFDIAKALALQPLPREGSIGMVTNGAGPCVMATDACVEYGLKVGGYSEETLKTLKERLPPYCVLGLAIDLTGSATSEHYAIALEALGKDPNVSLLMVFFVFQDTPLDEGIIDIMKEAKEYGKPILCCAAGGPYTIKQSRKLEEMGIPVYPTPERAVVAAKALFEYARIRKIGSL